MLITNSKKIKLLWERCINIFSKNNDIILSILTSNSLCLTPRLISAMSQEPSIENQLCQKRLSNQDKVQLILLIILPTWKNLKCFLQVWKPKHKPPFKLCPKDQVVLMPSIIMLDTHQQWKITMGLLQLQWTLCTGEINSIQVHQIMNICTLRHSSEIKHLV